MHVGQSNRYESTERRVLPYIQHARPSADLPNLQILDVGCGLCDNAIYLAAQGEDVTAIDFSLDALRQAETRIQAAKLPSPSRLRTRVADALNLQAVFGKETFDTVLDSAMLHCFNEADQRKYVESLTPHVSFHGLLPGCRSPTHP